jgi:hypothetical protein
MVEKRANVPRLLLGFSFLINGVNWWWKILPYPSVLDLPLASTPHFVQAMIDTGFLFDAIKVVEVITGIMFLANPFVPLALVIAFPVAVAIWAVDIGLLGMNLRAEVMGWSVLLLNAFLLFAYLESYKGLFAGRVMPGSYWSVRSQSENAK